MNNDRVGVGDVVVGSLFSCVVVVAVDVACSIVGSTVAANKQSHRTAFYRVAQNKMPHQTIRNIFATSGQILKILEAV